LTAVYPLNLSDPAEAACLLFSIFKACIHIVTSFLYTNLIYKDATEKTSSTELECGQD